MLLFFANDVVSGIGVLTLRWEIAGPATKKPGGGYLRG